jgi:hypothetical protein
MPGMPFHLEKGHALMALEDLFDTQPTAPGAPLASFWDDVRSGVALGTVFRDLLASAPLLSGYGGQADVNAAGGLGSFVSGAWFDQRSGAGAPPRPYWLDYTGDVDGIVREALLTALELAWGVDRASQLPDPLPQRRPLRFTWHCSQRWFEAWVRWDDHVGPVELMFATPAHTGGTIVRDPGTSEAKGLTTPVAPPTFAEQRGMILVAQQQHVPTIVVSMMIVGTLVGDVPLPEIGFKFQGQGDVGRWSLTADAGGVVPDTDWA